MAMSEYEKWQMNLVTAAEMTQSGLTENEVIRKFGERVTNGINNDESEEPEPNGVSESWSEQDWASMVAAFELPPTSETTLSPKVWADTPLERAYRKFVEAAEQLCERGAEAAFGRQSRFIEAVVNVLRTEHDSDHLEETAASSAKSLTTIMDLCGRGWDNLAYQKTLFGDLLVRTAQAAAELRDVLAHV